MTRLAIQPPAWNRPAGAQAQAPQVWLAEQPLVCAGLGGAQAPQVWLAMQPPA